MNRHQFSISPGIIADARRALWFANARVLAVADLHLGYAWAHRANGQLMPITGKDDTLLRLAELQREYQPDEIVVLGDIVHRAVALSALEGELRELFSVLSARSKLTLLTGNHDRHLATLLNRWSLPVELPTTRSIGSVLLTHGDLAIEPASAESRIVIGHEHPAISIGDGVTTSQKCPCFLVSDRVIVLPAFSQWAAGTDFRAYPLMSAIAREANFTQAIAICGGKLLPLPL